MLPRRKENVNHGDGESLPNKEETHVPPPEQHTAEQLTGSWICIQVVFQKYMLTFQTVWLGVSCNED